MYKKFKINIDIIHGNKSLENLQSIIKNFNYKKIILICDRNIKNFNYLKKNIKFIKKQHYFSFKEEPSYQQLDKEIKAIRKTKRIDCIIAIGGGSTLDFAKGVALLLKNQGNSLKFMGFPKNLKPAVPVIAIPTTTSTGSEIIYNAVFTNKITNIKLGINYEKNYPSLAILDPKLISIAPKKIIYQSAIASLMRSIETYTSPDSDKITRFFSKEAFTMLMSSLENKKKIDYKSLQWGCVFSMIALSNSSAGPSGIVNYYLSTKFNISQPFAYSFTALEFIKHNIKNKYKGYNNLIRNEKNNNIKNFNFIKNITKIQKILLKEINEAKEKIKNKEIELENIFKIFENKKFLPLKKNPIKIKQNELKKIISKIIN
tara:strand:- start:2163 stop:3281 length:1119 start_codon:yes stop_codon:yes gene_type:complete